ncbi:Multi antimicrobial extrusion protein [Carpediemonas membranifera]|uniref:Multi antimicrobial extrusion protein n=1 Tax=Carpediemonas membranifera TaxID=201153 RepID=A0A8J6AZ11_9EUKA|nr:Multi antimicrobial extrusion protein [Carpediemonas membranifera]|eukprot:KAG9394905.1 Multi antimicrobial extrusion protein [Carpediemonas membranifera]
MAVGQGALPLAGYCYGSHRYKRLSQTIAFSVLTGIALGLAAWVIVLLFPRLYLRIFTDDPHTIAIGTTFARIYCLAFFVVGFQSPVTLVFMAIKLSPLGMIVMLTRHVLVGTPLMVVLGLTIGTPEAVIAASPIGDLIAASLCVLMSGIAVWHLVRRARLHRAQVLKTAPHSELEMLKALAEDDRA